MQGGKRERERKKGMGGRREIEWKRGSHGRIEEMRRKRGENGMWDRRQEIGR